MATNDLASAALGTIEDLGFIPVDENGDRLDDSLDLDDLFGPDDDPDPGDVNPSALQDLDPDELRARVVKAEKKAAYESDLRLKASRKAWAVEAEKHFKFCQPGKITATSRRGFLEAAKEQHDEFVTRAKPLLERADESEAEIRARVEAEVEARYKDGWGTPTFNTTVNAAPTAETDAKIGLLRRRGQAGLKDITKALIEGGAV